MKAIKSLITIGLCTAILGCKSFVEVDPPENQISRSTLFENEATANAAMIGVYLKIRGESFSVLVSHNAGLSADEFTNYYLFDDQYERYYHNNLQPNSAYISSFWNGPYNFIYQANAIMEGVSNSTKVSAAVKKQLTGEAKFIRAFSYFYLTNFFGDVPLILTTDYKANLNAVRAPKSKVFEQVITDLLDAQKLLNEKYVGADGLSVTTERLRPNQAAATALLARVYLYDGKFQNAGIEAGKLIGLSGYSLLSDLNKVFLKNSEEAIWQIQPSTTSNQPQEASNFVPWSDPPFYLALSNQLTATFDKNSLRWKNWVGVFQGQSTTYYYPYKYKSVYSPAGPPTEYVMILRLAEQYLIRAEAYAQLGQWELAKADLNVIRKRAGLADYNGPSEKQAILDAILRERQQELFSEWGHRWFDLKRTGKVNEVMSTVTPLKGGIWKPEWALYPIPQGDMDRAPNIGNNNPGY